MMTLNQDYRFGACVHGDGVRFRLWAPAAKSVELVVLDGVQQPMVDVGNGFYETYVDGVGVGTQYQYLINGDTLVADPASRYQARDAQGPSIVVDLHTYQWKTENWRGRPWVETVIYELHIGTFTPEGTYRAAIGKLDNLVALGITAIEIMPLHEAPGKRNWGYDGVILFAPEHVYGTPEELQELVDEAHARGLMVFLDVVYNHFGPQGNYLYLYAPDFFTDARMTPWGAAIDLTGPAQEPVRQFFLENALLWLESYRFDGLRFDAAHELRDHAIPGFLDTLVATIRDTVSEDREVHLILENDHNNAALLSRHRSKADPARYDAQWNDDLHHALHVIATGETIDYYRDYSVDPIGKVMRALSQGFAYQGEHSVVRNLVRGIPSSHLPATSFVSFAQNHDQIGNRAFGERLGMMVRPRILSAVMTIILLSPMIPMLFMGEEWNSTSPFLYFCDFEPDLAKLVTEGRRKDFAGFPDFSIRDISEIPDPSKVETFERSRLNWDEREQPEHKAWVRFYHELLTIRRREIIPRLTGIGPAAGSAERLGERTFRVRQRLGDGSVLELLANLGEEPFLSPPTPAGRRLYATDGGASAVLAPWGVRMYLALRENGSA